METGRNQIVETVRVPNGDGPDLLPLPRLDGHRQRSHLARRQNFSHQTRWRQRNLYTNAERYHRIDYDFEQQ